MAPERPAAGATRSPPQPAGEQRDPRRPPQHERHRIEWRTQAHEVAIARHHPVDDLLVAVAGNDPLADDAPQIACEIGIRLLDALILADQAAKLIADGFGTLFLRADQATTLRDRSPRRPGL